MAGLGAGLQSAGNSAMQMLAERERRRREDELRQQQARLQDFNMGLELEKLGYEDVSKANEQLGKLRSAAEASPMLMNVGPASIPMKGIYEAIAADQEQRVENAREVPMFSGETRRMVLNPTRTPDAVATAKIREQERLRQQGNQSDLRLKAQFEDERNLAEQKGYFESLKRAGVFGPDDVMDPTRNYKADYGLYTLALRNQGALDVAKAPRTSTSTSVRVGGGDGTAGGLNVGDRSRLSAADMNRRTAANNFQRVLANRPQADPLMTDEENAAQMRRWAQGDSTFAANELRGMEQDLAALNAELGLPRGGSSVTPPPAPTGGSGFNLFGATGLGAPSSNPMEMQAQAAIAKIQASGLSPQEKARRIAIIRQRMGGR